MICILHQICLVRQRHRSNVVIKANNNLSKVCTTLKLNEEDIFVRSIKLISTVLSDVLR